MGASWTRAGQTRTEEDECALPRVGHFRLLVRVRNLAVFETLLFLTTLNTVQYRILYYFLGRRKLEMNSVDCLFLRSRIRARAGSHELLYQKFRV